MRAALNTAFVILVSFIIMGPALLYSESHFGCGDLPSWLTVEDSNMLAGAKSAADIRSTLLAGGFADGAFQSAVSIEVGNNIPCKAIAMLGNANLERAFISVSSIPFGYQVYPTYFGSEVVVARDSMSLFKSASTSTTYTEPLIEKVGERVANLIGAHSNVRWMLCLVDSSEVSKANPTQRLVSHSVTYGEIVARLASSLAGVGCKVVNCGYGDAEDYSAAFFHTDHHMQIRGGVRLCSTVLEHFGKDSIKVDAYRVAYDDSFFGSNSRSGLIVDYADTVFDVEYDRSSLEVQVDGLPMDVSYVCKGWDGAAFEKSSLFANVYAEYFHPDVNLIEIENLDIDPSAGSLLLISDSSDNSTSRLYAERYRRVYELSCKSGIDVSVFLDSHPDIVDAAFILTPYCLDRLLVIDK